MVPHRIIIAECMLSFVLPVGWALWELWRLSRGGGGGEEPPPVPQPDPPPPVIMVEKRRTRVLEDA